MEVATDRALLPVFTVRGIPSGFYTCRGHWGIETGCTGVLGVAAGGTTTAHNPILSPGACYSHASRCGMPAGKKRRVGQRAREAGWDRLLFKGAPRSISSLGDAFFAE